MFVLCELGIQLLDAGARREPTTGEIRAVATSPIPRGARNIQEDLRPREGVATALEVLEKGAALHGLQSSADADLQELADHPLAHREVGRQRGQPVDIEASRMASLGHQLFGFL